MRRVALCALAMLGAATALAGCSSTSVAPGDSVSASGNRAPVATQALTVFAAASLKESFAELASAFEATHPGVTVSLSFAGSADLVTQIDEGAPADVVALADEKNMTKLMDAALLAGTPQIFASNTLEIAVPPGNPARIASFADLAGRDVRVVVCAPQVPCGSATERIERATGVTISPVSEESAVTDVLGKVGSGEADAGLVYVTDVAAAGGSVEGIAFPEAAGAVNRYPIGVVAESKARDLAEEFAAFVTGTAGRRVLSAAGFAAP